MRWFLAALVLTLLPGLAAADPQRDAFAAYRAGQSAMARGEASEAAARFTEATNLLGRPNLRLQPLLLQSLFAAGEYRRFVEEYEVLEALQPDPNLAVIASLREKHATATSIVTTEDAAIAREAAEWADALNDCSLGLGTPTPSSLDACIASANAYLASWEDAPPHPWRDEARVERSLRYARSATVERDKILETRAWSVAVQPCGGWENEEHVPTLVECINSLSVFRTEWQRTPHLNAMSDELEGAVRDRRYTLLRGRYQRQARTWGRRARQWSNVEDMASILSIPNAVLAGLAGLGAAGVGALCAADEWGPGVLDPPNCHADALFAGGMAAGIGLPVGLGLKALMDEAGRQRAWDAKRAREWRRKVQGLKAMVAEPPTLLYGAGPSRGAHTWTLAWAW